MTDDPKRWLSERSSAGELERELLASVRDAAPPAHAKSQAWRGIASAVAAGAAVTSIAPSAAAASGLLTKVAWTIAAGSIAAGGYFAAQRVMPEARDSAPVSAPTVAPPVAAAPAITNVEPVAPEPAPQPTVKRAMKKSEPKAQDLLTRESAGLMRARAALRAGDAAEAQRLLEQMTSELPRGVLLQEREVLAIEVLAARGEISAASARARAFAKAHPTSPHTSRLHGLLDAP
jgi:hypothetical protein